MDLPPISNPKVAQGIRTWLKKEYKRQRKSWSGKTFPYEPQVEVVGHSGRTESVVIRLECFGKAQSRWIFSTYTYDVKNNVRIKLPDLFIADSDWKNVLWPCVVKKASRTFDGNQFGGKHPRTDRYYDSFSLDDQTLKLYFDQGVIASPAQGPLEVDVPLYQIGPILNPEFQPLTPGPRHFGMAATREKPTGSLNK